MPVSSRKVSVVVHLGAHRTGTTALQHYLISPDAQSAHPDLTVVAPPATRKGMLDGLLVSPSAADIRQIAMGGESTVAIQKVIKEVKRRDTRFLLSEENLIGTMEENFANKALYTDIRLRTERIRPILENADVIILAIRDLVDWWSSVIYFLISQGNPHPTSDELSQIANSNRSWQHVITELLDTLPKSSIVVREFNFGVGNLARQVFAATRWSDFEGIYIKSDHANRSRGTAELESTLMSRADYDSLNRLVRSDKFLPFSGEMVSRLRDRYEEDLNWCRSSLGPRCRFIERKHKGVPIASPIANRQNVQPAHKVGERRSDPQSPICMLHIGKTASTFLRKEIRKRGEPRNLKILGHGDTIDSTARKFGQDRHLAFTFRDPHQRFVLAFESRLRQGRPAHSYQWTVHEAAAFSFFGSAEELACALYSKDARLESAARFAVASIQHISQGFEFYLGGPEILERERERIVVCCDARHLDTQIEQILATLGVGDVVSPADPLGPFEPELEPLSDRARENLEKFFSVEFRIYEKCREIEREIYGRAQ